MLSSALSSLDDEDPRLYPKDRPARGSGSGGGRGKKSGGGGGGGRSREADSREVLVSKKLSYVLRHGAKKEGLKIDEGGWVSVADLLQWRVLRSMKVTLSEIQDVVHTNSKQRFEMALQSSPEEADASTELSPRDYETSDAAAPSPLRPQDAPDAPPGPERYRIRATQGHSLSSVQSSALLQPLTPSTPLLVVHGTTPRAWASIKASGGISRMGRAHVHFAPGTGDEEGDERVRGLVAEAAGAHEGTADERNAQEEAAVQISVASSVTGPEGESNSDQSPDGARPALISGFRASASILIWVAARPADGLRWWRSANNVILTEGNNRGMVPLECVELVESVPAVAERKAVWGQKANSGVKRDVIWRRGDAL